MSTGVPAGASRFSERPSPPPAFVPGSAEPRQGRVRPGSDGSGVLATTRDPVRGIRHHRRTRRSSTGLSRSGRGRWRDCGPVSSISAAVDRQPAVLVEPVGGVMPSWTLRSVPPVVSACRKLSPTRAADARARRAPPEDHDVVGAIPTSTASHPDPGQRPASHHTATPRQRHRQLSQNRGRPCRGLRAAPPCSGLPG